MTELEIFNILRPIVIRVTGVPECILDNQNAPSPKSEYAAIKPHVSAESFGAAYVENNYLQPQLQIQQNVRTQVQAICWINFYRGNAIERATRLIQCNRRTDVAQELFINRLGWAGTSQVNDLTALQSENFESRAQIAVTLWYELVDKPTINSIERVKVKALDEDRNALVDSEALQPIRT